jgi:hypothetical protein
MDGWTAWSRKTPYFIFLVILLDADLAIAAVDYRVLSVMRGLREWGRPTDSLSAVASEAAKEPERRAALQELVDLREDRPSFRVFQFLRSHSIFPTPYGYLFVLLVLGMGVKILELPLYVWVIRYLADIRQVMLRGWLSQEEREARYRNQWRWLWGRVALPVADLLFGVCPTFYTRSGPVI